ncbi:hypothetical protein [Micromonospora sp. KC606]|uniref:ATP-binding protein n=1 Tax=Micromonospora sp. KC606 TaxID=2530379 RepID=UPI001FB730AD|nr:hypothetical protein [Micromonospora sp. KC606]
MNRYDAGPVMADLKDFQRATVAHVIDRYFGTDPTRPFLADLAARLDNRFRVLTATLRAAPTRQRTLRAAIDWSWGLLSEAEQIVLRRLAACADGCTLEAAEAVCAGGRVRRDEVLDLLGQLVDRSLVNLQDGRYRLLESVAAYCVERLAKADGEDDRRTRERHLAYYVDFAEHADSRLRCREQRLWLGRLEAEAANIRSALAYAVRREVADTALRLVNALAWFWFLRAAIRRRPSILPTGRTPTSPRWGTAGAPPRRCRSALKSSFTRAS